MEYIDYKLSKEETEDYLSSEVDELFILSDKFQEGGIIYKHLFFKEYTLGGDVLGRLVVFYQ